MMNDPQLYGRRQWELEMLTMQPTEVQPAVTFTSPLVLNTSPSVSARLKAKVAVFLNKKGRAARIVIVILILITAITIYFTWFSSQPDSSASVGSSAQATTTQNFSAATTGSKATSANATTTTGDSGSIQVYIVGAVKRPGVYTLDTNARVYQVLKAAGGPLASANLVAVNLAAPLKDGEEIYIPKVGEQIPPNVDGSGSSASSSDTAGNALTPTASGALVNINTASDAEMRQQLHVSAKTAQAIISYRMQHGNYTSVDQLANAVSKTIYNRIKGMVTV
jgi:competence protein ComEA